MSGGSAQVRHHGTILVVQDSKDDAASLCRELPPRFRALPVDSMVAAQQVLKENSLLGAILDPQLSDGDAFELVDTLRQEHPGMPLLMVSSSLCAESLSRAHLANVPLVHRDNCLENLRAFAMQLNTHSACARDGIDEILEDLIHSKRLSLRESQILSVATYGIPRSYIARRLGLSENTIKTQIRSLLDKTQQGNLSEVVWLVHSKALDSRTLAPS